MRWEDYRYFILFLFVPLWAIFFLFRDRSRKKAIARFCDAAFVQKLLPSFSWARLLLKQAFFLSSVVFLVVALAEPQWGYHFEEVVRKGVDIMLVVDISNSMQAEDMKPNRLERAKRKIYDLLKMAQGDRIGMIVFAGRPVLLVPLTLDYQARFTNRSKYFD
ncbi:MAG: VWA domain-containing protein [bacterium]